MTIRAAIVALAACAAAAPLAAGCGKSEERDVRARLDAFAQATARKDYQRLCDDLFARELVDAVRKTVPCEIALRNSSLEDARDPKLSIKSIKVDGERASAVVSTTAANQPPSEDTVQLVKERGAWRIVALAS